MVNLVFMFLNLLPILPLDGGRIVASLLPQRAGLALRASSSPGAFRSCSLLLVTSVLGLSSSSPLVGASDGADPRDRCC